MEWVNIWFLELSTGEKNPLGRGTSQIVFFANNSKKYRKTKQMFLFCGGQTFAGVDNKRLGPMLQTGSTKALHPQQIRKEKPSWIASQA